MTEQALNWSGKIPVLRGMFFMVVEVGKYADKHCLRREVGMRSRSQNMLDDWEMIFDTSSLVTWEKTVRLVGVCRGSAWGDESVEEDFNAV